MKNGCPTANIKLCADCRSRYRLQKWRRQNTESFTNPRIIKNATKKSWILLTLRVNNLTPALSTVLALDVGVYENNFTYGFWEFIYFSSHPCCRKKNAGHFLFPALVPLPVNQEWNRHCVVEDKRMKKAQEDPVELKENLTLAIGARLSSK